MTVHKELELRSKRSGEKWGRWQWCGTTPASEAALALLKARGVKGKITVRFDSDWDGDHTTQYRLKKDA